MPDGLQAILTQFDDPAVRRSEALDALVREAAFGAPEAQRRACWLIWEIGQRAGVRPASIHELYLARGRGDAPVFTTPAINVRMLAYDTGRAIFRAATRLDAGAVICELAARSPIPGSAPPSTWRS
jgi:fructose-bisphosphate aldolase class II